MNKKKILVLGGGSLQVPLIKKINEMGYISLCVDKNPEAIGFHYANYYKAIDIVNREKCLQYAIKNQIDAVLTVATDFPIETVSYIVENMKLVGNNVKVAKLIKNKYEVKKAIYTNNKNTSIQFFEIKNSEELNSVKKQIQYPVIVKPVDGSGSKAISKIEDEIELEKAVQKAVESSICKKAFIETFIQGEEYGVESFVDREEVYVLGIMKKHMTKYPNYAELGHCIPSGLSQLVENKIKNEVKRAIKILGIQYGSVNMDIILSDKNEVNIIDVGARMGGNLIGSHIIPNATGVDVMQNLIKQSLGEQLDLNVKTQKNISTKILNFGPGIITNIDNIEELIDRKEVIDIVLNKKIGDEIGEYRTNADACGWVVVSKETMQKTEEFAEQMKENIRKKFEIRRVK